MQQTKESWENFNPKEFEETVCAGGAEGVASKAPEHMLGNGVQTFGGHGNSDKPDEENLADKPPVDNIVESWADFKPEMILSEQDQQAAQPQVAAQPAVAPQQPATTAPAQAQAPVTQPVAQQPVAPVAPQQPVQPAVQQPAQPISTQPAPVAPQSQIVNQPQQNQVVESWENVDADFIKKSLKECDMDDIMVQAEPDFELGKVVEVPENFDNCENCENDEITNALGINAFYDMYDCDEFDGHESISWENFTMPKIKEAKINESIALPGGVLNSEPTEYEKELDKHNQARKNTKSPEVNLGDKDAGEIGVHDFDENGMPTDVKEKVKTDMKPTELKPNKNAVEVDQKKKWDD